MSLKEPAHFHMVCTSEISSITRCMVMECSCLLTAKYTKEPSHMASAKVPASDHIPTAMYTKEIFLIIKKNGQGTYTWSNGDKYIGICANDEWHGEGINIFASGERYEGSFAFGKWNGKGINTWPNGEKHEGIFVNNKLHE